jgi:hypothetical protein
MNDLLSDNAKNLVLHKSIKLYFANKLNSSMRLTVNGIEFHKEHNSFESVIEFFKELFIKTPFNYHSLVEFHWTIANKLIIHTQLNPEIKQERYKPVYDRFIHTN